MSGARRTCIGMSCDECASRGKRSRPRETCIAWNSLGVDLPELGAFRLLGGDAARRLMDLADVYLASRAWVRRQIASSGALVCVTLRAPGASSLVEAGRLDYHAWLLLDQAGWGVQPFTLPSLMAYNAAVGGLPASTRPELASLFRRGRGVLTRAFDVPQDEVPVWMFRTGISTPLPGPQRALRLPLDRVLTGCELLASRDHQER